MDSSARFVVSTVLLLGLSVLVSHLSQGQPIRLSGGNITLSVSAGIAGGEPIAVTNSVCTLRYKSQGVLSKITVQTSCPGQKFSLSVIATSVTRGVAAPQVSVVNGNPALDFITSIPGSFAGNATCTLQYTASATFSQGNSTELGSDLHSITYTYLAQ